MARRSLVGERVEGAKRIAALAKVASLHSLQKPSILSIGAAWVMAAVLSMMGCWLTEKLKEDWQMAGRWVVLLLLIQILPLTLTGRRAFPWARLWLLLSSLVVLIAGLLWWCAPGSAELLFPATFAVENQVRRQ